MEADWIGIADDLTVDKVVGAPYAERVDEYHFHAPTSDSPSLSTSSRLKTLGIIGAIGLVLWYLASGKMAHVTTTIQPAAPVMPLQEPAAVPQPPPPVVAPPVTAPVQAEAKPAEHKAAHKKKAPHKQESTEKAGSGAGTGDQGPSSEVDLERYRNLMRGL